MVAVHPITDSNEKPIAFVSEKKGPRYFKSYSQRARKNISMKKNALIDIFQDCFNRETISLISL